MLLCMLCVLLQPCVCPAHAACHTGVGPSSSCLCLSVDACAAQNMQAMHAHSVMPLSTAFKRSLTLLPPTDLCSTPRPCPPRLLAVMTPLPFHA